MNTEELGDSYFLEEARKEEHRQLLLEAAGKLDVIYHMEDSRQTRINTYFNKLLDTYGISIREFCIQEKVNDE